MTCDNHGQPVIEYRRSFNKNKLFNDLLGVCEGLAADETLKPEEAAFLDAWLKESRGLLDGDTDVFDIQDLLKDILADGKVTTEELEDLLGLLDCVVRHRGGELMDTDEQAIQRLIGVVRGIIADNQINEREILHLQGWMHSASHLRSRWPVSAICQRIEHIFEDGVITSEEQHDLLEALTKLVGGSFQETGSSVGNATRGFEIGGPQTADIIIPGRCFLFTGKFVFGTRKRCQEAIVTRGGMVANTISRKVHYVVVGTLSSRDWMYETHGGKIEAAMARREDGHQIAVISEEAWAQYVR